MKNLTSLLTILLVAIASMAHASLIVNFTSVNNVKCFGGRDGAITSSASGGTSPYTYLWSTGATTAAISGLPAGYYAVTVTDNVGATASRNGTLTEPTALSFTKTPSVYNTSFNISLYGACNGYINTSASGGTTPYSYLWSSGQTTANLTNLCASVYSVTLTDANLCTVNTSQSMTEPDKASWDLAGNSGSSASTNFMGTIDSVDFVIKSYNAQRMRIKANGKIQFNQGTLIVDSAATDSARIAYIDHNGILKSIGSTGIPQPCKTITNRWWTNYCSAGNDIYNYPSSGNVAIGLETPYEKLHVLGNAVFSGTPGTFGISGAPMIYGHNGSSSASSPDFTWNGDTHTGIFHPATNVIAFANGSSESMRIGSNGTVYIGVGASSQVFQNSNDYTLIAGKLGATEMWCALGTSTSPWPDYVFKKEYKLKSLKDLEEYVKAENHLPGMPSSAVVEKNGKINIVEMQTKILEKTEENTLYILQLNKEIEQLKEENIALRKMISGK